MRSWCKNYSGSYYIYPFHRGVYFAGSHRYLLFDERSNLGGNQSGLLGHVHDASPVGWPRLLLAVLLYRCSASRDALFSWAGIVHGCLEISGLRRYFSYWSELLHSFWWPIILKCVDIRKSSTLVIRLTSLRHIARVKDLVLLSRGHITTILPRKLRAISTTWWNHWLQNPVWIRGRWNRVLALRSIRG